MSFPSMAWLWVLYSILKHEVLGRVAVTKRNVYRSEALCLYNPNGLAWCTLPSLANNNSQPTNIISVHPEKIRLLLNCSTHMNITVMASYPSSFRTIIR